ncbi:MAG TPA: HAD family hydrolase [Chthoniobacteraceae bacterium]|jgi:FMN phosphatase YigB (HAD superfamily)|nr:HAD family hydrolase [Chthoniobacteraceae bacterium]
MSAITTVFFDLGDTLGTAIGTPAGLKFEPFQFAAGVLTELRAGSLRLGVISNTGAESRATLDKMLEDAQLLAFFEPALLIYSSEVGLEKDSPAIFQLAAERAGEPAAHCLFVGENAEERGFALEGGLAVCPHPLLVAALLSRVNER